MSTITKNPFFQGEWQERCEHVAAERSRRAKCIDMQKRVQRLHRENKPDWRSHAETHNGITTLIVQEHNF